MSWLPLQTVAQISIERILNALPEGFLIALFAWALLRVLRRQNSGTRFAVWFVALLTVAALPVLGGFGEGRTLMAAGMSAATSGRSGKREARDHHTRLLGAFCLSRLGSGGGRGDAAFGGWALAPAPVAPELHSDRRGRSRSGGAKNGGCDWRVRVGRIKVVTTTSECVRVPAAIGFWKRTIVLPAWALRELPPEDLNVILLHEFAHLRRWDDWTNLIQKIVRALFFFHPAVWWIENRLSVEREMACDDAVLAETANPHGYATCLVSLLEKSLAHRLEPPATGDGRWSRRLSIGRARLRCGWRGFSTQTGPWPRESGNRRWRWLPLFPWSA